MKGRKFAFPLLILMGCGGNGDAEAIDSGQQSDDGAPMLVDAMPGLPDAPVVLPPDARPPMFHGTPPLSPKPVPTFMVLNRDGTPRTQDDLIGHPTVIWFYPAAFTAG